MIKISITCFFSLLFLIFLSSCKHETLVEEQQNTALNPIPPTNSNKSCDPDTVYFQNDILPLLRSNCAFSGCHGNGSSQDGVKLENYFDVINTADVRAGDPEGSDLYEMITENDPSKRMPRPRDPRNPSQPLAQDKIDKIRKWIEQGALNNSCENCDTTNVTFTLNVKPIIEANCQGCHSGSNPQAGVSLTNFSEISTRVSSGQLLGAIKHQSGFTNMPYNQPQLDFCLIEQIEIWINQGAQNN